MSNYFTVSLRDGEFIQIHRSISFESLATTHARISNPILCSWNDPTSIEDVVDLMDSFTGERMEERVFRLCNADTYNLYRRWRRAYSMKFTCSEVFNIEGSHLENKIISPKWHLPWDTRIGYLITLDQRILRLLQIKQ